MATFKPQRPNWTKCCYFIAFHSFLVFMQHFWAVTGRCAPGAGRHRWLSRLLSASHYSCAQESSRTHSPLKAKRDHMAAEKKRRTPPKVTFYLRFIICSGPADHSSRRCASSRGRNDWRREPLNASVPRWAYICHLVPLSRSALPFQGLEPVWAALSWLRTR